jgi:hypothetical protein
VNLAKGELQMDLSGSSKANTKNADSNNTKEAALKTTT